MVGRIEIMTGSVKLLTATSILLMVAALILMVFGGPAGVPWPGLLLASISGALVAGASIFGYRSGSVLKPGLGFGLSAAAVTLTYFLAFGPEYSENPERFFGVLGGGTVLGALLALALFYAVDLRSQR